MSETAKERYERLDARLEELRAPLVEAGVFSRTHTQEQVMLEEFKEGALELVRDHNWIHRAVAELEYYFDDFDWEFPSDPDR